MRDRQLALPLWRRKATEGDGYQGERTRRERARLVSMPPELLDMITEVRLHAPWTVNLIMTANAIDQALEYVYARIMQ